MKPNKKYSNVEINRQSKFLSRSHSQTEIPFFCCATPVNYYAETTFHTSKHQAPKMSVKELMKKSSIQLNKSQSNYQHNFNHSRGNSSQLYSHSRQQSGDSSHFNSIQPKQKINFSYMGESEPPEKVQNYHTTNYIVDKYIVQPQEVNIILPEKSPQQNQKDRFFDLSGQFQQEEQMKKGQNGSNNCHFSFGKNQKQQFMGKYLGFTVKEVESKRQSRNSKESGFRGSYNEKQDIVGERYGHAERQILFQREFQKTSLLQFVRDDVSAIDSEELQDDSNDDSQVIEDYRSIMGRKAQGQRF